jgi:hypothetical protein
MAGKIGRLSVAVVCALLAALAACGSDERAGSLPADAPRPSDRSYSPTTPRPTTSADEQILAQYKRYLAALFTARTAAPGTRERLLGAVAGEPLRRRIVKNMKAQDDQGVTFWGSPPTILSATVTITGQEAQIHSCLDDSSHGQLDTASKAKLTIGPPRNPSIAKLSKREQGPWLVTAIAYPGGTC